MPGISAFTNGKEPSEFVWNWYLGMCAVSIFNIVVYLYLLLKSGSKATKARKTVKVMGCTVDYETIMTHLTLPFVVQCAYRSFFPAIYNERVVFFDTPYNCAFICRALAHIGEVCWITQLGAGLI